MRKLAILLASGVTAVGLAGVGSVMTAAPAHALGDPLAQANVVVLPANPSSIVTVCLTVRPSPPGCLTI
jgi:hypothetical protein